MDAINPSSTALSRQLDVYINHDHIGKLTENNGLWQFQYTPSWLELTHSYPLAPYLPLQQPAHMDTGSQRPVQLQQMCRRKGLTALRLFRWVLFNFFTGNSDAHLKNLSFSYQSGDLELLPHYDLLSTIIYAEIGESLNQELSHPLGTAYYFGQVRRTDLITVAAEFGLKQQIAEHEIDQMATKLNHAMNRELERFEQGPDYRGKPGEGRMLRQIKYLAIQPLTALVGAV